MHQYQVYDENCGITIRALLSEFFIRLRFPLRKEQLLHSWSKNSFFQKVSVISKKMSGEVFSTDLNSFQLEGFILRLNSEEALAFKIDEKSRFLSWKQRYTRKTISHSVFCFFVKIPEAFTNALRWWNKFFETQGTSPKPFYTIRNIWADFENIKFWHSGGLLFVEISPIFKPIWPASAFCWCKKKFIFSKSKLDNEKMVFEVFSMDLNSFQLDRFVLRLHSEEAFSVWNRCKISIFKLKAVLHEKNGFSCWILLLRQNFQKLLQML